MANDTDASITEGLRLWPLVGRPNLMVKVPATDEGMPVIRRLIAEGLNVNITLMFGAGYYEKVIDAFFSGLEDRVAKKLPIDRIASVASCFVSRVDTEADKRIQDAITASTDDATKAKLTALLGQTAIANSKRLYTVYLQSLETPRWKKLAAAGARKQRPLWASTSTKNPKYPDVYYVEALIGPDTVDTMPPATIDAFRDHGKLAARLEQGMEEAEEQLQQLEALGISLKDVTDKLLADGLVTFEKAYDQLLGVIDQKAKTLAGAGAPK
jgi:transaldolase